MQPQEHTLTLGSHSGRRAWSWLWTLSPALANTTVCMSVIGPCHYMGTCRWSQQPSVCMPLAPGIISGCPCPQPLGLEALLRVTPRVLQPLWNPLHAHQGPQLSVKRNQGHTLMTSIPLPWEGQSISMTMTDMCSGCWFASSACRVWVIITV